jgi:hypothetical protein
MQQPVFRADAEEVGENRMLGFLAGRTAAGEWNTALANGESRHSKGLNRELRR